MALRDIRKPMRQCAALLGMLWATANSAWGQGADVGQVWTLQPPCAERGDLVPVSLAPRRVADSEDCSDRPAMRALPVQLARARIRPSTWAPPPRSGVVIAGFDCTVDGMRPWSFSSPDDAELRFEVRSGDRLSNPETGYQDPENAERSEVSFGSVRWRNGTAVEISYEFLVPAGFDFDSPWTVIGQMHADLNVSPPFEVSFRSGSGLNRLFMVLRDGSSAQLNETEIPITEGPVARDVWHKVKLQAKMGSGGFLRAWVDDVPSLAMEGQIGINQQTNWYWRMGLYRRASPTTYQVRIRRFSMDRLE
ncbi:heparin lyase I family protein [Alsobacter sp. SYSU BS001988]